MLSAEGLLRGGTVDKANMTLLVVGVAVTRKGGVGHLAIYNTDQLTNEKTDASNLCKYLRRIDNFCKRAL